MLFIELCICTFSVKILFKRHCNILSNTEYLSAFMVNPCSSFMLEVYLGTFVFTFQFQILKPCELQLICVLDFLIIFGWQTPEVWLKKGCFS